MPETASASKRSGAVRLLVVEKVELYRLLYSILPRKAAVAVTHVYEDFTENMLDRLRESMPDALLIGAKRLDDEILQNLAETRRELPDLGIALLVASFSHQDGVEIQGLMNGRRGGLAVFLRQSLDDLEQLSEIVLAVGRGQVVLDNCLASLVFGTRPESPFLKSLTARETEIMSLLADGLSNSLIGEKLFIDTKTVEHHLNNIYSKLRVNDDLSGGHKRVLAARYYLQSTGETGQPPGVSFTNTHLNL